MTAKEILYLVLIYFALVSCERNHVTNEKVLSDIFPQLVDSLQIKWRPFPPPPPPPIFDKDSNYIGVDSIKMEMNLFEHNTYLNRIDSIDSRIFIAIIDTCYLIDWHDLKTRTYSQDSLISRIISLYENESSTSKKLNLNKIDISEIFNLISKSEIEEKYPSIWSSLKDYKFAGLLEISNIYFTEDYNNGLLQIDYYYHKLNGYGFNIVIEKTNDKWRVQSLLRNWVT